MGSLNTLRQLIRDLRSQRLRTFLTTFGIVWGTIAVSLLLAFGEGLHHQMIKNAAGLGNGVIVAWPSYTSIPFEGLGPRAADAARRKRHAAAQTALP